ncbi:MAG: hypothetical protein A4E57_00787 [Syntrophorhabdaceae bacterium PtaU1.Bin034]|nr:MAG: hypothetical protein A4E57_00787 [Syntrophorhabdaceae bacterium PtaU1.Bin034]
MIRRTWCILLGIIMIPCLAVAGPNIPGFYGSVTPALPTVLPTARPILGTSDPSKPQGSIQGLDPNNPYYRIPGTNKSIVNQVEKKRSSIGESST